MKQLIHNANNFLNKPIVVIVVLVLLFAYFAAGNAQFERENRTLLRNSTTAVDQLKKVLCEDIPESQCNLSKAVATLKVDNARQTAYLKCLLALNGRVVDKNVDARCKQAAQTQFSQPVVASKSTQPTNTNKKATQKKSNNSGKSGGSRGNGTPNCTIDFLGLHLLCQ